MLAVHLVPALASSMANTRNAMMHVAIKGVVKRSRLATRHSKTNDNSQKARAKKRALHLTAYCFGNENQQIELQSDGTVRQESDLRLSRGNP